MKEEQSIHCFQSFREEGKTGPQQTGREMDASGVGSCWRKSEEPGRRREPGRRNFWWVILKILHTHHGNSTPTLSYTHHEEKSIEKSHEHAEGLGRIILTSEVISIPGEQMEKSGTKDASLNTGLYREVTPHDDKEQDVSLIHKVEKNFQEQEYKKCSIELYSMWCDPSDFQ